MLKKNPIPPKWRLVVVVTCWEVVLVPTMDQPPNPLLRNASVDQGNRFRKNQNRKLRKLNRFQAKDIN